MHTQEYGLSGPKRKGGERHPAMSHPDHFMRILYYNHYVY